MPKNKNSGKVSTKAAAKAAKKAKTAQKTEKRDKKKASKSKEDETEDLEGILDKIRREWEEAHTVTEELVEGPPSRRANATLTACPSSNYLWCIGGEFFSEDGKAYFYNDIFRYNPEKDEWRKFVSPMCPGPRSAHAVVSSTASGGKLFLFGGEFSSLHQNTFHHYRDFWCFDIPSRSWDRIDTKIRPSARSGHRMAMWKHFIVLFGGFYDPGITTRYLSDLWIFDTQEYNWRQIELKETDRKPSPRSGFSFLPTADGILLHGGYCKEYAKGKRPVGIMLEDTWFLRMTLAPVDTKTANPLFVKWEPRKRPSTAFAPSIRSGCTMTLWSAKNMGILFGGVTDEDTNEETLESVFWNDLYGYQLTGNGRWVSIALKKKKKGGAPKKKGPAFERRRISDSEGEEDHDNDLRQNRQSVDGSKSSVRKPVGITADSNLDPDDPTLTTPLPRYNSMLAVLRNTLYIYGGIYERGSREYTLDDFHSLQLDKLERYICLKQSEVVIPEGDESSSDEDDDDEDDDDNGEDDDDDEVGEVEVNKDGSEQIGDKSVADDTLRVQEVQLANTEQDGQETAWLPEEAEEKTDILRQQATAFMGVAKDSTRSAEDVLSTPLPGETLAMFYARSREFWTRKAHGSSDNRGKLLRRDGFALAEERYAEYKPILQEVERILAEAGLDEEEMRRGAAVADPGGGVGQSRNRR